MNQSAFIDINELSEEGKKELEKFYEFLIFKFGKKKSRTKKMAKERLAGFLSNPIDVEQFQMLNREERNDR